MIDKQKIENLFSELDTYLEELKDLSLLPEKDFLKDSKNIYSARYLLQVSIETCINIGNHIISRKSFGVPKEYADTFRIMESNNIIPAHLLEKLIQMTRFRNRIVHLYWDIDDRLVLKIIKEDQDDFTKYRNCVLDYLKQDDTADGE